jgi:hypothetical protein
MTGRPQRNRFDRALRELQVTLNIARRNSLTANVSTGSKAGKESASGNQPGDDGALRDRRKLGLGWAAADTEDRPSRDQHLGLPLALY